MEMDEERRYVLGVSLRRKTQLEMNIEPWDEGLVKSKEMSFAGNKATEACAPN